MSRFIYLPYVVFDLDDLRTVSLCPTEPKIVYSWANWEKTGDISYDNKEKAKADFLSIVEQIKAYENPEKQKDEVKQPLEPL